MLKAVLPPRNSICIIDIRPIYAPFSFPFRLLPNCGYIIAVRALARMCLCGDALTDRMAQRYELNKHTNIDKVEQ